MPGQHRYQVTVEWTGNRGEGTAGYRSYDRDHDVRADDAATIAGSSDPHFRGNRSRWNPEQLFVASVSQCHMLSYLHHAASNGVVVTSYVDHPIGVMTEDGAGGGAFTELTLHPVVTVSDEAMVEAADHLHADANRTCFIAQSLTIPVQHEATTLVAVVR